MSAWNSNSTDGRRPSGTPTRALSATCMTSSVPPATGRSGGALRSFINGPMSSAMTDSGVSDASDVPLGLMYRTPSVLTEMLPPPPRANSGSLPNRRASATSSFSKPRAMDCPSGVDWVFKLGPSQQIDE